MQTRFDYFGGPSHQREDRLRGLFGPGQLRILLLLLLLLLCAGRD
jgi:hypothetical protein